MVLLTMLLMLVTMTKLTKLYILARSFGAESSSVQANCITWPTWIPASWDVERFISSGQVLSKRLLLSGQIWFQRLVSSSNLLSSLNGKTHIVFMWSEVDVLELFGHTKKTIIIFFFVFLWYLFKQTISLFIMNFPCDSDSAKGFALLQLGVGRTLSDSNRCLNFAKKNDSI